MTDHAPLTDEELAAMEQAYEGRFCDECDGLHDDRRVSSDWSTFIANCWSPAPHPVGDVPRLIADLRAARAEVDSLKAVLRAKSSLIAQLEKALDDERARASGW